MSTQNQVGASDIVSVDLVIPNTDPQDWGDILPIHAEVFAYLVARSRQILDRPLTAEDVGRDVGIHILTVKEAIIELSHRGFIELRPRPEAGG